MKIMDYAMYPSDGGPNAYRAIFTALDLWSRKMYAVPIKNKEGSTVAAAIKDVNVATRLRFRSRAIDVVDLPGVGAQLDLLAI